MFTNILEQISKFIILSSQIWVVYCIQPYSGYHRIDSVRQKPCYEGRDKGVCLRGAKLSCPWTEPLAYFHSRSRYVASMTPHPCPITGTYDNDKTSSSIKTRKSIITKNRVQRMLFHGVC
jgi:hypothetical protein